MDVSCLFIAGVFVYKKHTLMVINISSRAYFGQQKIYMDAKKLGKKIKLARIEMDMTQVDLAQATDIMQKSISRYETGQSFPTLETLEKIAKTLKKPYSYFLDE